MLLAPGSLIKYPAASASDPTGRHPNDTRTWRTNPPTRYPHIAVAIPTLVSADPDISWVGSYSNHSYSDRRRWRNPNYRLCNSDYSSQQQYCAKSGASEVHRDLLLRNSFCRQLRPRKPRPRGVGTGLKEGRQNLSHCRAMASRTASSGETKCSPLSSAIESWTPFTMPLKALPVGP